MTRIERLEEQLDKLYEQRAGAVRQNNFYWMEMTQAKINKLEKELIQARQYAPKRLSELLGEYGEETKNRVFKALLRISLASDFLNECAEEAKSVLKELDLTEHTLTGDVESLCKLSQKIASFVILPNSQALTDMLTDNAECLETCLKATDEHLKSKLGL